MLIELYIFAFATIAYGTFITLAIIGFGKIAQKSTIKTPSETDYFSIVVSAKNEAKHIEEFIHQIVYQNFPKSNFELILIDDASNDDTYELAKNTLSKSSLTYQLIKQQHHKGKKQNISEAISISKGSVIITTDADVIYRSMNWLVTIAHYFNTYSPNMLIMPVDFKDQFGILSAFQIIENSALTGVTAGYAGLNFPFMCNGANLAFKKSVFQQVSGYQKHLHISSGEDVFLLEDFKKIDKTSIHYSLQTNLIVKTNTVKSLNHFFSQRIRWASKTKQNSNKLNLFAGLIITISNLLFLALFVAIIKKSVIIPYLSIFVLAKLVFDFLLLFLASNFLGRRKYVWWLIPFEAVYWIYALIVGIGTLVYKPYWKGKKIK